MRELLVMLKRPQCQTHKMMSEKRTSAPFSPNTSIRICSTGCPYLDDRVALKSWIENSRESRTSSPKMALNPTEETTPMGADQDACVSLQIDALRRRSR